MLPWFPRGSTGTAKIPSKQFLYHERGIQRFPDLFTRESGLLSKLQSNALLKRASYSKSKGCAGWSSFLESLGTSTPMPEVTLSLLAQWLCRNRGTPLLHVSSTKEWWDCRKAVAVTNIMAWVPPFSLSFPSSPGFSRITPQLYERRLRPQPQHYKRTREANPSFAHLRESPALLLSLCGCCQPFHTSHLFSFLLGACSLPRHP